MALGPRFVPMTLSSVGTQSGPCPAPQGGASGPGCSTYVGAQLSLQSLPCCGTFGSHCSPVMWEQLASSQSPESRASESPGLRFLSGEPGTHVLNPTLSLSHTQPPSWLFRAGSHPLDQPRMALECLLSISHSFGL